MLHSDGRATTSSEILGFVNKTMAAALCFDYVSNEFLSSLLDNSVVFTALLVEFYSNKYPSRPNGLLGHSTLKDNC